MSNHQHLLKISKVNLSDDHPITNYKYPTFIWCLWARKCIWHMGNWTMMSLFSHVHLMSQWRRKVSKVCVRRNGPWFDSMNAWWHRFHNYFTLTHQNVLMKTTGQLGIWTEIVGRKKIIQQMSSFLRTRNFYFITIRLSITLSSKLLRRQNGIQLERMVSTETQCSPACGTDGRTDGKMDHREKKMSYTSMA